MAGDATMNRGGGSHRSLPKVSEGDGNGDAALTDGAHGVAARGPDGMFRRSVSSSSTGVIHAKGGKGPRGGSEASNGSAEEQQVAPPMVSKEEDGQAAGASHALAQDNDFVAEVAAQNHCVEEGIDMEVQGEEFHEVSLPGRFQDDEQPLDRNAALDSTRNANTECCQQGANTECCQQGGCETSATSYRNVTDPAASVWKRTAVVALPAREVLGSFSVNEDTVQLDADVVASNMKKFEAALAGRLFGRRIPFFHLSAELKRRWERYGQFRIVTISGECFVCFFDSVESRDAVLMGGPWVLAGQVLGLDKWSPAFSPSSKQGFITPAWVRLPGLPLYCWDAVSIARITGMMGEPLWLDAATDKMERGDFARACVRLDLSKPLKSGIWVQGPYGSFFQPAEYEGLSTFCFKCGLVGHKELVCPAAGCKGRPSAPRPQATILQPNCGARAVGKASAKEDMQNLEEVAGMRTSGMDESGSNEQILEMHRDLTLEADKMYGAENEDQESERGYGPRMIVMTDEWLPQGNRSKAAGMYSLQSSKEQASTPQHSVSGKNDSQPPSITHLTEKKMEIILQPSNVTVAASVWPSTQGKNQERGEAKQATGNMQSGGVDTIMGISTSQLPNTEIGLEHQLNAGDIPDETHNIAKISHWPPPGDIAADTPWPPPGKVKFFIKTSNQPSAKRNCGKVLPGAAMRRRAPR